jgi:tRNA (guanine37-N1)-methyltransferase
MLLRGLNTSTIRKMSQRTFLDPAPPIYSGDKGTLDKSVFRKSLDVLAAKVPAAQTGIMLKAGPLKRYLQSYLSRTSNLSVYPRSIMDLPKVRSVVVDPSDPIGGRLILFRVSNEGTS